MKRNIFFCSVMLAGLMGMTMTSCSNDKDYGEALSPVILIKDLKLNVSTSLPLAVGMQKKVEATITNDSVTKPQLAWTSTNPAVATVGQDGTIDAKAVGTARINIGDPDEERIIKFIDVTVMPTATAVKLEDVSLYEKTSKQATASVALTPENAYNVFEWSSSDESVVTVDADGTLHGLKPGTATLTAKTIDGSGLTASSTVTVKEVVTLQKVTLHELGFDMMVGEREQAQVDLLPADATPDLLKWESSNENVVKVDGNGMLTAVGAGTATIKASDQTEGSTLASEITVTVAANGVISSNMAYLNNESFKALGWSIGNNATTKFDGTGLVVTPSQTSGNRRADFVMYPSNKKFTFDAGTYRYFVLALTPFGKGSIKLDTNKGDFGAQPNGWLYEGSDGIKVGYWDLQKKFSATATEQSLFQFKMADISTPPYDYTIYWLHTFKTLEDAQKYVDTYYKK